MYSTAIATLVSSSLLYMVYRSICSVFVFPGQLFAQTLDMEEMQSQFSGDQYRFSEEKVSLFRNIKTVEIEPNENNNNVIIIFNGQNATFRSHTKLTYYAQLAEATRNKVVGFDYAGTGRGKISVWSSGDSLVQEGFHMAKKVWSTMPKEGALILKGNSLGGAIAIKVAKLCHDNGIKAYVWNGCSFVSTSAVAAEHLRSWVHKKFGPNTITNAISKYAKPVIAGALRLAQFEIDVTEDYKKIPDAYKNYYIVRSQKDNRHQYWDDTTIPYATTLESDPEIKQATKNSCDKRKYFGSTTIGYYRKNRKMTSTLSEKNPHNLPETELYCRHLMPNWSAYKLFCEFATQYVPTHSTAEAENDDLSLDATKTRSEFSF